MPRAALANVSMKQLVAELKRRQAKLADLIARRDALNEQIEELEALGVEPLPIAPAKAVRRRKKAMKPGPKPKAGKKPKASRKRKSYPETAEQFVLGLVKDKGATTAGINKAWKESGRTGRADTTLSKMVKDKKLKREDIEGKKGSRYTVA